MAAEAQRKVRWVAGSRRGVGHCAMHRWLSTKEYRIRDSHMGVYPIWVSKQAGTPIPCSARSYSCAMSAFVLYSDNSLVIKRHLLMYTHAGRAGGAAGPRVHRRGLQHAPRASAPGALQHAVLRPRAQDHGRAAAGAPRAHESGHAAAGGVPAGPHHGAAGGARGAQAAHRRLHGGAALPAAPCEQVSTGSTWSLVQQAGNNVGMLG